MKHLLLPLLMLVKPSATSAKDTKSFVGGILYLFKVFYLFPLQSSFKNFTSLNLSREQRAAGTCQSERKPAVPLLRLSAGAWTHTLGCRGHTCRCPHLSDQTHVSGAGSAHSKWRQQMATTLSHHQPAMDLNSEQWLKDHVVIPWTRKCAQNLTWASYSWESAVKYPDTKIDNCPKAIPLRSLQLHKKGYSWSFIAALQGSTVLLGLGRLGFNSVWTVKQGSAKR